MADVKKLIGFPEELIKEAEKVMGPEENFAGWVRDACREKLDTDKSTLDGCTDVILAKIDEVLERLG